ISHFLRGHTELPAAAGLALLSVVGEGASRPLRGGDLRGIGTVPGRRRGRRPGPDRQLGPGPRPVPPWLGAGGPSSRLAAGGGPIAFRVGAGSDLSRTLDLGSTCPL